MPKLELRGVTKQFGGLVAVSDMSMDIGEGMLVGLIGPNGAGKTTLLNMISGLEPVTSGNIAYGGVDLLSLPLYKVISAGISRTFQIPQIYGGMTVLENVMVGAHSRSRTRTVEVALKSRRAQQDERELRKIAQEKLAFVGLESRANDMVKKLPFGQIRLVEFARALASMPSLLLLDEPASGSTPAESQRLSELFRAVLASGVSILLVEHDVKLVMSIADYVVVMNHGQRLCEGSPEYVQCDSKVIEAYLGKGKI